MTRCPICKEESETWYWIADGGGATNYACPNCGTRVNSTPFGIEVLREYEFKSRIREWEGLDLEYIVERLGEDIKRG